MDLVPSFVNFFSTNKCKGDLKKNISIIGSFFFLSFLRFSVKGEKKLYEVCMRHEAMQLNAGVLWAGMW